MKTVKLTWFELNNLINGGCGELDNEVVESLSDLVNDTDEETVFVIKTI